METDWAKPRGTARWITVITVVMVVLLSVSGRYVAPYGTALGQLVLAVITLGFIASLAWMRALTLSQPQPRLFLKVPAPGTGVGSIAVDLTSPSAVRGLS